MNIPIEQSLVVYLIKYMKEQDVASNKDAQRALQGLEWTLSQSGGNHQPNVVGGNIGQKQIPNDPRRTDVGMGPILNTNSDYI